jgi:hypothetical protein
VQQGCVPRAAGAVRAKVIACDTELVAGRLAMGRIGDFVIENDRVRVIVRGPGEGLYLGGMAGGGIVDAAPQGGEDLIKEIQPAIDLAVGGFDELVITEAGDDGPAELVVRGPAAGLDLVVAALGRAAPEVIVEHHYRLAADAAALELETRVFSSAGGDPVSHDLYEAMFLGGRARAFVPGVGFEPGAVGGEVIATSGTTTSYGLVYPAEAPLPQLIDLAGIRLVVGPNLDDNAPGARRWLAIGDGSIASVTELGWTLRGVALGAVTGSTLPALDVVVSDGAGMPVTIARADAAGVFRAAVPAGSYTLRADAPGQRAPGPEVPVTITAGQTAQADVTAGASGTITVTVEDLAGAAMPARVILESAGQGERIAWIGASGTASFAVVPGDWRVSVSRGVEYTAVIADPVPVADGATVPVAVTLERVVDTSGWISIDTHLHCELSTDSTIPVDDRVRAVAAEGVEVPVSSDHDFVTDYAPVIAELGLEGWVGTLPGNEASSLIWGHLNAFPLAVDPARVGGGAVRWLARSPGEVFAALRQGAGAPDRIIQVNHPRKDSNSLFDAIDLDPDTLTALRDPTSLGLPPTTDLADLSFDAVEVANTLSDDDFEEVFADWLAMVAAGHPAAATGSSDSHGDSRFPGGARTYVWVGNGADDPATVDPAEIVAGIRARHVVVATGSFVNAGIVTPGGQSLPGHTVNITGATVTIHITVQAAPWQATGTIRIYQGTQQVRLIELDPLDTAPVRFDDDVTFPTPAADTFWVVRVDPAGDGAPVVTNQLPSFVNPLFADVP